MNAVSTSSESLINDEAQLIDSDSAKIAHFLNHYRVKRSSEDEIFSEYDRVDFLKNFRSHRYSATPDSEASSRKKARLNQDSKIWILSNNPDELDVAFDVKQPGPR